MGDDEWRDTSGKRLVDYPRPSLAVDVAVLTVLPPAAAAPGAVAGGVGVVVHRRTAEPPSSTGSGTPGEWSLPGTFLHEGERLTDAAMRALADKVGIGGGVTLHELRAFDDPARDPRGWVVSVSHAAVVSYDALAAVLAGRDDVVVRPLPHDPDDLGAAVADLAFDHQQIVAEAVRDLRATYREYPDPFGLIPEPFTLLQLRLLHEAILGEPWQKDTFRRRMEPHLTPTDRIAEGTVGRPARLFHHPRPDEHPDNAMRSNP